MKKIQLILFVLIMFLVPNVYAAEFNMNNYTSATQSSQKGQYGGTEFYYGGIPGQRWNFGTRYDGRLNDIITFFSYPFEKNTTYRFTYNMATNDFNNNFGSSYWWDCEHNSSATVFVPTYVSYKKVQYSITPSENTTCIKVQLYGKANGGGITQISNWNLSSITLYDPDYQSGSGSGQGTSPSPTSTPGASNQDIINSNEHNTQDIINNQNDNTNNIIENNNNNTQDIINSTQSCQFVDKNKIASSGYLDNVGIIRDGGDQWGVTDYINIYNGKVKVTEPMYSGAYTCFYDSNKTIISCVSQANFELDTFLNLPQNSSYARFSIYKTSNIPTFEVCLNGNQATTDAINQQNEYLMDNSDPSISDNDFLNTFNSIGVSDPLSYLLTLPTQLINKIVSLSDTCTAINLGTLYGTMISLPCINIENILGSSAWSIIDVIFSVSLLVVIFKNLYDTFSNLLTMGAQKEAKEKFSMPTPMDFLSMILGGDR